MGRTLRSRPAGSEVRKVSLPHHDFRHPRGPGSQAYNDSVPSPRPLLVLRLVLLALVGVTAADTLAGSLTEPAAGSPPGTAMIVDVLVGGLFALFATVLWITTRPGSRSPRRTLLLLVLQFVLVWLLSTDLLAILAAQVALLLPARRAASWMALQVLLTVLFGWLFAGSAGFYVNPTITGLPRPIAVALTVLGTIVWQLLCFAVGLLAATEGRARAELTRRNAELAATQTLLEGHGRLAERLALARELHDTLGHHLTVLSLQLELARQLLPAAADERLRGAVDQGQTLTRLLLADVRDVVGDLREDRPLSLSTALASLARGTQSPAIQLVLPADLDHLEPSRAHTVFRCVQEAITNAVRHAGARNVWIEIRGEERTGLAVTVRDDGRGAATFAPGHGLTGMRERLEALGGRLEVEAGGDHGFALRAFLPPPAGAPA